MLSDLRNINTQFRAFDWEHIGLRDETTMEKKKVRLDENRGKGILRTARGNSTQFEFIAVFLKFI